MSTPNNGGPAFPTPKMVFETTNDVHVRVAHEGMSLRDYFAATALQGFIASFSGPDCQSPDSEKAATCSYSYADAMLKAREA